MKWFWTCIVLFNSLAYSSQNSSVSNASSIQFPFKLAISSLEDITNSAIKGVIYKDSLYTDNQNDQLKCTVWKDGNILITSVKNNVLKIDVPLKVWIEKGIGAFGAYTYQSTEFKLVMSFHLVYTFAPNWKLTTKTLKNGYTWTQKPSLNFASVKVPITPIVEKILESKQAEYANLIDMQIAKNIQLKNYMVDFWNAMKKPQKISEEYNTWLAIVPNKIEAHPFIQDKTHIKSAFKVYVQILSCIGSDSLIQTPLVKDIPALVYRDFQVDSFQLYTFVTIPYSEATQIAQKKFINQNFSFNEGKYTITVTDINLYSIDNKLMIETSIVGSFKGKIYIHGDIYYDATKNAMRMRNLEFDMKTKNILHKAATWIFNRKIEKNFEENFEMPVAELLNTSLQATHQALNRKQNGIAMKGNMWQLIPTEIICDTNAIILTILGKGRLTIEK